MADVGEVEYHRHALREFRGRKALPPRRAAAAQAEGRATRPLRRRVHIPLYIDQRLGHDRRGDHTSAHCLVNVMRRHGLLSHAVSVKHYEAVDI